MSDHEAKSIIIDEIERNWKKWRIRIIILIPALAMCSSICSNAFVNVVAGYNLATAISAIVRAEPHIVDRLQRDSSRLVTDSSDIRWLRVLITERKQP